MPPKPIKFPGRKPSRRQQDQFSRESKAVEHEAELVAKGCDCRLQSIGTSYLLEQRVRTFDGPATYRDRWFFVARIFPRHRRIVAANEAWLARVNERWDVLDVVSAYARWIEIPF